jgi:uncharacterized protein YdeI (YjbR/CyaY-like superfamily)
MKRTAARPQFFKSVAEFRAWLEKNGGSEMELVVGFHKVDSGKPSITWSESVDEALCFGWIDGVRTRIDKDSYRIRFTPRKKDSIWSAINIAKAEQLTAEGRMESGGRDAYARRTERKSGVYSYEQGGAPSLSAADEKQFRRNRKAWAYFQVVAPSYRRAITHWVTSAKQEATRQRRLQQAIEASAQGTRLLK